MAHHCVFCQLVVPARSIRKHYGEQHQGLMVYEYLHRDQIYGLANLGNGRGTCVLYAQTCTDIQNHQYGILLQINILLGQIYDISHFPTIPLRMTMLLHYFQELVQLVKHLKLETNDDFLIQNLISKGILTEDHIWVYLTWDSQAMMLKPNKTPPLTSEEIRSLLERIAHIGLGDSQVLSLAPSEPGEFVTRRFGGNSLAPRS